MQAKFRISDVLILASVLMSVALWGGSAETKNETIDATAWFTSTQDEK
jgi:hypothetical protein